MPTDIKAVVLGVGHMGLPAIFALCEIKETLRATDTRLQIVGLIDANEDLKPALEFIARALDPVPVVKIVNHDNPDSLLKILAQLGLNPSRDAILLYDATPAYLHYVNLSEASRIDNLIYCGEKPLLTDDNHLKWLSRVKMKLFCDFIETESRVFHTLKKLIKKRNIKLRKLRFWRMNTIAYSKLFKPQARSGVAGGALMDKASHDLALSVALLHGAHKKPVAPTVRKSSVFSFIPCFGKETGVHLLLTGSNKASDRIMSGFEPDDLGEWTADACGHSLVDWNVGSGEVEAEYHYSWVGLDDYVKAARDPIQDPRAELSNASGGNKWLWSASVQVESDSYQEEDVRMLLVEGEEKGRAIALGINFLARPGIKPWIRDISNNQEIPLEDIHFGDNSLARVFKNSIQPHGCDYGIGRAGTILAHDVLLRIRKEHFKNTYDFADEWSHASKLFPRALLKDKFVPSGRSTSPDDDIVRAGLR